MLGSSEKREHLQAALKKEGVPTMIYYPRGLHEQTAYKWMKLDSRDFENTVYATEHVLSLPMHPYLDEATVNSICDIVRKQCV